MPETLPSHASMMTGLYPAGHGVRQNARPLAPGVPPRSRSGCSRRAIRTAAFVSAFVLARRFGLARGFDVYDDALPAGGAERASADTTDRALAVPRAAAAAGPVFLWVHYFDPHAPYAPPEPFRAPLPRPPLPRRGRGDGRAARRGSWRRSSAARRARSRSSIAGDHGEGLGDHGESQHGNLLYQVDDARARCCWSGPASAPGVSDDAGEHAADLPHRRSTGRGSTPRAACARDAPEVVLGEAMKPFLSYGWQPQVMAVEGRHKAIRAGRLEVYDVVADPAGDARPRGERGRCRASCATRSATTPSRRWRRRRRPRPSARRREAAGQPRLRVSGAARPSSARTRRGPADRTALFDLLEKASGLFVPRGVRGRRPAAAADPGRGSRATSTPAAPGHRALVAGAGRAGGGGVRGGGAPSPPAPRTCAPIARCTTRGARTGRARCPLLERIVAESPSGCPPWRRWP